MTFSLNISFLKLFVSHVIFFACYFCFIILLRCILISFWKLLIICWLHFFLSAVRYEFKIDYTKDKFNAWISVGISSNFKIWSYLILNACISDVTKQLLSDRSCLILFKHQTSQWEMLTFNFFRYFTSVINLSQGFVLIACSNGTYGKECNHTCGYCLDQDECHHINGTCVKGCDPGYLGDLCKTSTYTDCDW